MKNLKKLLLILTICLGLSNCQQQQSRVFIVNMGDSYTSGDGSKKQGETWQQVAIGDTPTHQTSQRCHRTKYNRTAVAVANLKQNYHHLEYLDVSCSGATIFNGILGTFAGHQIEKTPQLTIKNEDKLPLDSQIDQVKEQLINNFNPDRDQLIIVLSIGGNDIGFSSIIAACSFQFLEGLFKPLTKGCEENINLKNNLKTGIKNSTAVIGLNLLPAAYGKLAEKLEQELNPDHVLITQYPDPTRDSQSNFCGGCKSNLINQITGQKNNQNECINDQDFQLSNLQWGNTELIKSAGDFVFNWGTIPKPELIEFSLQAMTKKEMEFAYYEVLIPLNQTIKKAAEDHNWILVSGLDQLSVNHGVCSQESWFNTFEQSWQNQDTITGVLHPNAKGHEAFSKILEMELKKLL